MNLPLLPPLRSDPLVSVMIVNYNYGHYLGEAVESVLGQSYQNFEIVICDDGSGDNSRAVIESYAAKDARIRPIFKANAGVAAALNDAYRATSGEILCPLDADDLFLPEKLARVVERFHRGGRVGLVVNSLTKVDSQGREIGRIPQFGRLDRGELRERILHSAAHWSVAPTSGMSMRRECAERVFPIPPEQFRTEADGYMSTVAPLFYAVDAIDDPLTIYRVHTSNLTASTVVDVKWCERGLSAARRTFAALAVKAKEHDWKVNPVEYNPFYGEMQLVRDFLNGASFRKRLVDIAQLQRAAFQVRTSDWRKTLLKAGILSGAALLPRSLGKGIIERVYLPNRFKKLASVVAASTGTK